jgi:hypothetical protein
MNQQYKVTQKWYRPYPIIGEKAWASWKIALVSFVLFNFMLQIGTHWGNYYPSASQRGLKPQQAHNRPLMIAPFDYSSGGIRADRERDAQMYATANVDDYAFKTALFSSRNMW